MFNNLRPTGYHNNEDYFRKLGIDSHQPVADILAGEIWETTVEGASQGSYEGSYDFEATIGEKAAQRLLQGNVFDRFLARTVEQDTYEHDEDLEWRDGLIVVEPDSNQDYLSLEDGDLPWRNVEFLPMPYNSRHSDDKGFSAEDWKVT